MAKFAKVGYGSHGQGVSEKNAPDGYDYIVDDNVNVGDKIQVVATSVNGNKFGTTAVPLSTYGKDTIKGQETKIRFISKGDSKTADMLSQATDEGYITQADLDAMIKGKITQVYRGTALGLSQKGLSQEQYRQQVRGGNLQRYRSEMKSIGQEKPEMTAKAEAAYKSYTSRNEGEQK